MHPWCALRVRVRLQRDVDLQGAALRLFLRVVKQRVRAHDPGAGSTARLGAVGFIHRHRDFGVLALTAAPGKFPWRPRTAGPGRYGKLSITAIHGKMRFMESVSVRANAGTWKAGGRGALEVYIKITASGAARATVPPQAVDENLSMRRKLAGCKPAPGAG